MGDRSDILNRSSSMQQGNSRREERNRPGARQTQFNKRPNADGNGPSAKKHRPLADELITTALSPEYDALLSKLSMDNDEERKRELKAWAQSTVMNLGMNDLNYFLQSVKKTVENKKSMSRQAKQKEGQKSPNRSPLNNSKESAAKDEEQEGSADGNKPTLSGSFYPLAQAQDVEAEKQKAKDEKAFQRPRAEKRSAEEESQYQELLHSIAENPVVVDDELNEVRFHEIISAAMKIAKKLKDWFQVWSHARISGDNTAPACVMLVRLLIEEKNEEETADILSHLMKEKEISPKHMEEAIKRWKVEVPQLFEEGENAKDINKVLAHLLVFIYPTSKNDFGWHRVGWGWAQWWQHAKKYTKDLEKPIDSLGLCCKKLVEYRAPDFDGDKQEKLIARGIELCGTREAAVEALGIVGDPTYKPAPSPITSDD